MTIDWPNKIINVPKSDLTYIGPGEVYNYDMNIFRKDLKDLEDDEGGMPFIDTHVHNPPVTIIFPILFSIFIFYHL